MAGCAAFPVTDVVFNRLHFVVLQHMWVGSACSLMPLRTGHANRPIRFEGGAFSQNDPK